MVLKMKISGGDATTVWVRECAFETQEQAMREGRAGTAKRHSKF
jgi:hypothetical protein